MPRRPSSEGAVQTAKHFLQVFIAHSDSDDHILPKNGAPAPYCFSAPPFPLRAFSAPCALVCTFLTPCRRLAGTYSPFYGFCTMLSHHASVKDGGSGVEGISRGRLNKMAGSIFQEGMRKVLTCPDMYPPHSSRNSEQA